MSVTIPVFIPEIILLFCSMYIYKKAKQDFDKKKLLLLLIFGFVNLLFEPLLSVTEIIPEASGGAVQLVSETLGIYYIFWAINFLVKGGKSKEYKVPLPIKQSSIPDEKISTKDGTRPE